MALAYELRCRECAKRYENAPLSICDECFSPLEVFVDLGLAKHTVTRESIAEGPASMWRYQALLLSRLHTKSEPNALIELAFRFLKWSTRIASLPIS